MKIYGKTVLKYRYKLKLVFVTTTSRIPSWLEEIIADYKKKLSYWFDVEVRNLQTRSSSRENAQVKKQIESEKFLEFIKAQDYFLLCDEGGKGLSSLEFSSFVQRMMTSGKKRIVIAVGGAYGVSDEVKERADKIINLSSMVMNHHIAFTVILEQVYRAMTIIKGIKYHNE